MDILLEIKIKNVEDLLEAIEERRTLLTWRLLNSLAEGRSWQQVREDKQELTKLDRKVKSFEKKLKHFRVKALVALL